MHLFTQDTLEMCSKENEFKSILFSLVYFHAVVVERRKFGPQGWNRSYPYNTGDLTISVNVLFNYLEANNKVCKLRTYKVGVTISWLLLYRYHGQTCATYLARSCTVATSLTTGTEDSVRHIWKCT